MAALVIWVIGIFFILILGGGTLRLIAGAFETNLLIGLIVLIGSVMLWAAVIMLIAG